MVLAEETLTTNKLQKQLENMPKYTAAFIETEGGEKYAIGQVKQDGNAVIIEAL